MQCKDAYEQKEKELLPICKAIYDIKSVHFWGYGRYKDIKVKGREVLWRTENRWFKRWELVYENYYGDITYKSGHWEVTLLELAEKVQREYWQAKAKRIGVKECD